MLGPVKTALGGVLTLMGVVICVRWYIYWDSNYRGRLLMDGPYARVRHPFYSGFLLLAIRLFLLVTIMETMMLSIMSFAVIAVYIPREEDALIKQYGNAYREYVERVKWRLIPGIY